MRSKVISALFGAIFGFVLIIPSLVPRPAAGTYPTLLKVSAVRGLGHGDLSDLEAGWLICLKDAHGHVYKVHADSGDYDIGEYYCCTMSDNGTAKIMDDTVIDMRYVRVDMFE